MVKELHTVRTAFDKAFLKELAEAGEISITKHDHVFGLQAFIKRLWRKNRK